MNNLENVFNDSRKDKGLIGDLRLSLYMRKKWEKVVGAFLAKEISFEYIKEGQCVVSITNPCWFSEINVYRQTILKNINASFSAKKKVRSLKVMSNAVKKNKGQPFSIKTNYDNMIGR